MAKSSYAAQSVLRQVSGTKAGRWLRGHLKHFWGQVSAHLSLKIVFPMLLGLLLVFTVGALSGERLFFQPSLWLLSAPLMFYIYLRKAEEEGARLSAPFSFIDFAVSACAFFAALFLHRIWEVAALLLAVAAASRIFLNYPALRAHAKTHRRDAAAASLGAASGIGYFLAQAWGWKLTGWASAKSIWLLLHRFIPDMSVFEKNRRIIYGTVPHPPFHRFHRLVHYHGSVRVNPRHLPPPRPPAPPPDPHTYLNFMAVGSNHGMMRFYVWENALNGMFLWVFTLSVWLLLWGKPLARRHLAALYLGGMAAVFAVNSLALTFQYWLMETLRTPGTSAAGRLFGKLVYILYSSQSACFVCYAILIGLILAWLYRPAHGVSRVSG